MTCDVNCMLFNNYMMFNDITSLINLLIIYQLEKLLMLKIFWSWPQLKVVFNCLLISRQINLFGIHH
jgi:hypothetical protein